MATHLPNPWWTSIVSWLNVFILVAILVLLAGRHFIAWFLMKLYEIFIQQNPFRN